MHESVTKRLSFLDRYLTVMIGLVNVAFRFQRRYFGSAEEAA